MVGDGNDVYDVVILGGGFAGLHAARCCALREPERPGGGKEYDEKDADDAGRRSGGGFRKLRCVVLEGGEEIVTIKSYSL